MDNFMNLFGYKKFYHPYHHILPIISFYLCRAYALGPVFKPRNFLLCGLIFFQVQSAACRGPPGMAQFEPGQDRKVAAIRTGCHARSPLRHFFP